MLEKMTKWLQTFPLWEDSIQIDYVDACPGSTGLYPKGLTESVPSTQYSSVMPCSLTLMCMRTSLSV